MYHYIKYDSSFIKTFKGKDTLYFHVFNDQHIIKMETEAPIYEQIMQIEAIEWHKWLKIIEQKGGRVFHLSTDKVTCSFPDNILPFELDGDNFKG